MLCCLKLREVWDINKQTELSKFQKDQILNSAFSLYQTIASKKWSPHEQMVLSLSVRWIVWSCTSHNLPILDKTCACLPHRSSTSYSHSTSLIRIIIIMHNILCASFWWSEVVSGTFVVRRANLQFLWRACVTIRSLFYQSRDNGKQVRSCYLKQWTISLKTCVMGYTWALWS